MMSEVSEIIRCPVCLDAGPSCNLGRCRQECLLVCPAQAIAIGNNARVILDKCSLCLNCVNACPLGAIDKVRLAASASEGVFICPSCKSGYKFDCGVWYLYPGNFRNKKFLSFYQEFKDKLDPWQEQVARNLKAKNIALLLRRNNVKVGTLLDVGCSGGWVIDGLKESLSLSLAAGLELSSNILKEVSKVKPYINLIAADCEHMPFGARSFDLALLVDVIEHISDPLKTLRELGRVSRNVVLKVPIEDVFEQRIWHAVCYLKKLLPSGKGKAVDFEQHINLFTRESALDAVSGAGLRAVDSFIPDNPLSGEYTRYYFAHPAKTMRGFKNMSFGFRAACTLKYYAVLSFRRVVFILFRRWYHRICFASYYIYCVPENKGPVQ